MIEINWGKPLSFSVPSTGDVKKLSTIEQAQHWLNKRWPIVDETQVSAAHRIDEAIAYIGSVRRAFIAAAKSVRYTPEASVAS